jgi:cytochrome c
MKKTWFLLAVVFVFAASFSAHAGSEADAKAMAKKAIEHIKKVGEDKAYTDFSTNPGADFKKDDLYVFCVTYGKKTLAHGAKPTLKGKVLALDFFDKFTSTAKASGEGWVEYKWTNPKTNKVEHKKSYIQRVPDKEAYCGVGIYVKK